MDTAPEQPHKPFSIPLPRLAAPPASIVICNHNYAAYLPEAIASALAQRPQCQIVVVDDGSTDGSRALLQQTDPRVQVVLQPNGGQLAAYNTGFAHCTGDVVIFLDADDVLQPHAARALAGLFDEGVAKVHCRMDLMDETGLPLGATVPSTLGRGNVAAALLSDGVLYPSAPGSGNAYRRSVLQRLFPLPLDAADRVAADFFTIYGTAALGRVAACDAALVRYRIHRRVPTGGDGTDAGQAGRGLQGVLQAGAAPAAPGRGTGAAPAAAAVGAAADSGAAHGAHYHANAANAVRASAASPTGVGPNAAAANTGAATAAAAAASAAAASLVFGNAAQGNDEAAKVATRYARLARWLLERSDGVLQLPAEFLDFSVQKTPYAAAVLSRPYWTALRHSGSPLRRLLRSLWLQPAFSARKKLGLSVWALLVLASPRALALPLARHVCNPASRGA